MEQVAGQAPRIANQLSLELGLKPFRDILRFTGRSTRTELFSSWLVYGLAGVAVMVMHHLLSANGVGYENERLVTDLVAALLWLPSPALWCRRLHDVGVPGWPAALSIAVLGAIFSYRTIFDHFFEAPPAVSIPVNLVGLGLLVAILWNPTEGPNRYGPDPRL